MERTGHWLLWCFGLAAMFLGWNTDACSAARIESKSMRVIGWKPVSGRVACPSESPLHQADSKLRSAYLLRARKVFYNQTVDNVSQLREHFGVVVRQLLRDTEQSLDLALQRWEQHTQRVLTSDERVALREQLRVERSRNLVRLIAYQSRGLFPQNRQFTRPVPVFVDEQDTACAVGHLMRESGWESAVEMVARASNLVYVTDVSAGPVYDWILQSGLTQEEAALIQPGYGAPEGYIQLIYDPANGGLILDSGIYELTALEIQSPDGYFTGTRPAQVNGLFDVFNPHKLFVLKPAPLQMGDQDFGPALAPGLNRFQTQTLKVAGAVYPSGTFEGYCINTFCVPEPSIVCGSLVIGLIFVRRRR